MSLIESALRKMQEAAQRKPEQKRSARPSSAAAGASPQPVALYRPCSLDAPTMEQHFVLPQISDDAAHRAYKILRTRLSQRLETNRWQSLAVTSTQAAQGKTLTSINLAIALAQDPQTFVFLVDLDLWRPKIASTLGMTFEHGLSEYLLGEVEAEQVIYESGIDRLAIVPNAKAMANSSDLLASGKMSELIDKLVASTPRRIIIFDMPPLMLADDVIAFSPRVDGVLLVVTERLTTRASVQDAKEVLKEMNLIGVILNRSAERSNSDYY